MKSTFVIYHANCPDGFAAAFVASLFFEAEPVKCRELQFIPASYGDALPDIPNRSEVYILDFSYSREVLINLAKRCGVCVIDHHLTAARALDGLSFAHFDNSKSGAVLAWEYFFPDEPVPEMLLYVMDRDLWRWGMPNSKEFNAGLWRGLPRDFFCWKMMLKNWPETKSKIIEGGKAISFSDGLMVENLCRAPVWLEILGNTVPAVNSPVLQSEIGHELLQQYPNAPFAAAWWILEDGKPTFSLRGRADGVDVSAIAKEFGGGGHPAAAGFRPEVMFEILKKRKGGADHE